ncbi:hypothetical protein DCCM_0388 [Desulfocucumis palustris]|uniref:Low copy number virion structural protein n=1 Tax=Desulfocucumis palustris TaxID=1898651 RepID=A0A2L2X7M5_9FIRM|nr:Low copy number virion structural protein [Desulfocucumis palustris]GBF32197.1 hypothetical protein DCCM_0388 [Desulfocucumis palustris]
MFTLAEIVGGRLSPPFMPTKTQPYILGRLLHFPDDLAATREDTVILPFDAELLSVAVGASRYYPTDRWSLTVNGEKVFDSVYTKDLPEGAFLVAVIPVAAGQVLKFSFDNTEGMAKYIWFNYQFLK